MDTDPINYRQLDELLLHLGFTRRRVEPKWLSYEHAASDTVIALVEKQPDAPVRLTDAVSARRHLVEKGLITEEELRAHLTRSATAAKTTPAKKS
jgi:hypothetical protein